VAKRMTTKFKDTSENIEDLLARSESTQVGPNIYSNLSKTYVTANECIIDFYLITPPMGKQKVNDVKHVQRVIMPLGMAKSLSTILRDSVDRLAAETGIVVPDFNAAPLEEIDPF
jgi:hypothetical protein